MIGTGVEASAMRERPSIEIPVHETSTACAGAAASHVLRRISYRAGAYAPGIQDGIFDELHETRFGATIADARRWFVERSEALHALGYRLEHHCCDQDTSELVTWIRAGRGYRGVVVATDYDSLHPGARVDDAIVHAVGLTMDGCEAGGAGTLVMIDPWSTPGPVHRVVTAGLESARRRCGGIALAFCWIGWR